MDLWGRERAADLRDLVDLALPDERLTLDELEACCWDGDGRSAVVATPDGDGAVSVACRAVGDDTVAVVLLLAVAPVAQERGQGRALLDAAETWAFDGGASAVVLGGLGPHYLWPGVDVRFTRALCLAESAGYAERGAALNLSCPTTFRRPEPEGASVRRVLDDADVAAVRALCREAFGDRPAWELEAARGIEHGSCHAAFDLASGEVVGFACHSVNRAGWFGPIGTVPSARRRGVGAALLSAVCVDLRVAGFADVEIAWIGPVGFYARTAGASVSRVFRTAALRRRDAAARGSLGTR